MSVEETLICDVCQKEPAVGVAAVPGVPMSCAYCKTCLGANAHPLFVVIGNTALVGGYDNAADWWQYMVDCTLEHLGKTREWFDAQVAESLHRMDEETMKTTEEEEDGQLQGGGVQGSPGDRG